MAVTHLGRSAGRCWFSTHKLLLYLVPHKSTRSCQYWSIQSCSRIHFGRCPVAVCLRSASFRSFVFVIPCFLSIKPGVLVLSWSPRCCTLWPLGEGVLVVVVTARPSPYLRGVVYDVHDCFIDRHNKKAARSKRQAWWLNKSPRNSAKTSIPGYTVEVQLLFSGDPHFSRRNEACCGREVLIPYFGQLTYFCLRGQTPQLSLLANVNHCIGWFYTITRHIIRLWHCSSSCPFISSLKLYFGERLASDLVMVRDYHTSEKK